MKKKYPIWLHFLLSFLLLIAVCAVMVMTHKTAHTKLLLDDVTVSYTGTNGRGKAHLDADNRLKIEKRIFSTVCKKHGQKIPNVVTPKELRQDIKKWNKSSDDTKRAVAQEMKDLTPKIKITPGSDLYNGQKITLSIKLGKLDQQETLKSYILDTKSKKITVRGLK